MFNIKKKLNAILPGEGARGALQNVLTVDWSGNKTVLVEIPNAGASRSNEVEMNGMGDGGYGQYGRLNDEEQDEREYLTQPSSRFNISRGSSYNSQTEQQSQYAPPLPPKNPSYSKEHPLHPNDPFRSTQPYDEIDQLDDFAPRYQQPQNPYATQPKASAPNSRAVDEPRGWHTFSNSTFDDEDHMYGKSRNPGAQRPVEDPWSGKNWGIGNGVGQASPTTSTSTRNSGGTVNSDEDPFR